jgi:hypothetical protein
MSAETDLYETDFVLWAEAQAGALREAARAGTNLPLDWENLAEEIESLGKSQRRELRSRLTVIVEHLLKLEHSRTSEPRSGWMRTIDRERSEIEIVLDDSPSLRREVARLIEGSSQRAARFATSDLFGYGEAVARLPTPSYTEEQVLGDWFPEPPKPLP